MTLSIDVLPAPFGPMMARISPFRMSKETPRIAFTPPNESEMFLDLQKKLALRRRHAMRGVARLLGKRAHSAASARTPRYDGLRHVVDRDVGGDHALAAVLEGDLGLRENLGRAVVERLDQRRVAPADRAPPHFLGPRELSVIRIELFVEDQEAAYLAPRHGWLLGRGAGSPRSTCAATMRATSGWAASSW